MARVTRSFWGGLRADAPGGMAESRPSGFPIEPRSHAFLGAIGRIGLGVLLLLCAACQPPSADAPDAAEEAEALWSSSASLSERTQIILSLQDGIERAHRFTTLLESADPGEALSIAEVLEFSPRDIGDIELALFGEWWATFDPAAAFQWAEGTWRSDHPRVISTVVRTWARQDPRAAYQYGFENRPLGGAPFFRDELIDAVIVGWSESGQPGALAFALAQKKLTTLQRALRALGRIRVALDGPEKALVWARDVEIADDTHKRYLMLNVASAAADQDPRLTAAFLGELRAAGGDYPGVYQRIAARWARYEPVAAMEWVEQLEEGEERDRAIGAIATHWLNRDPEAARAWIEAEGPQPWLGPAIGHYIRRELREAGPDTKWQAMMERWTLPLANEIERWGTTSLVLQRWSAHDEEAALAWLDAHPDLLPADYAQKATSLTDEVRAQILRQSAPNAD